MLAVSLCNSCASLWRSGAHCSNGRLDAPFTPPAHSQTPKCARFYFPFLNRSFAAAVNVRVVIILVITLRKHAVVIYDSERFKGEFHDPLQLLGILLGVLGGGNTSSNA